MMMGEQEAASEASEASEANGSGSSSDSTELPTAEVQYVDDADSDVAVETAAVEEVANAGVVDAENGDVETAANSAPDVSNPFEAPADQETQPSPAFDPSDADESSHPASVDVAAAPQNQPIDPVAVDAVIDEEVREEAVVAAWEIGRRQVGPTLEMAVEKLKRPHGLAVLSLQSQRTGRKDPCNRLQRKCNTSKKNNLSPQSPKRLLT